MSSELVKKLEDQKMGDHYFVLPGSNSRGLLVDNHNKTLDIAIDIVKQHEAQQMKEPLDKSSQIALDQAKDIYLRSKANWELVIYGIDKHSHAKKSHVISRLAEWAIEQEKLKEEK
ncbi:TPA: hypothetical protein ACX1L3_000978 [Listeria monocytogenes]|uniref:hypothetical protein n=1 Tax=Listeria monocytogenes TaxID=1639 RepID=UPI000EBEEF14|nr:hypothetical protein [Listeria monocytogenes]EAC3591523.1 hypothetical protein [Listeria monocytogenes]EAC5876871.1 hypothetical protein [Listeria monocytogenes]EAC6773281.1 hypothetical protein [Listeria monocytogenes]EAD4831850.1 hypothetical protein [Listeria monocytogenes]EAD9694824.1 hypothetical protein [Listeria monocytogenes]